MKETSLTSQRDDTSQQSTETRKGVQRVRCIEREERTKSTVDNQQKFFGGVLSGGGPSKRTVVSD